MDDERLSVKLYRHKTHKDLYLIRTNLCGGSKNSAFYETTNSLRKALDSVLYYEDKYEIFEEWMNRFKDENGVTELKVKTVFKKEMEFDGYKGILEKEIILPVSEFEIVELKEGVKC